MKRDMDLVRDVLLAIERNEKMDGNRWFSIDGPGDLGLAECSHEQLAHTLRLLDQAGLVKARTAARMPLLSGLTWNGHEFLDTIRDLSVWQSTKARASSVAGAGLELMWELAKAEAKKKLGLT